MKRLVLFCLFLLLPFSVGALGISVSPGDMKVEVVNGKEYQEKITVQNISGAKSEYQISTDDFVSWFWFSEPVFVLDAGETKQVDVRITPDLVGEYHTNISVVSFYVDKQTFNAGSGVKIVVTLNVLPPRTILGLPPLLFATLIFFLLIIAAFAYRSVRTRRKAWKELEEKMQR